MSATEGGGGSVTVDHRERIRRPRRFAHGSLDPATPVGRRAGRGQRGNTLVEAAFALPILFAMVMGLIDFGVGVLQTSQVSGAAADGARSALLWKPGAVQPDVVGSPAHNRVKEAVEGRLMGHEFTFQVNCITPSGSTVACSAADPDRDRIKVTVRSPFEPVSPLGHSVAGNKVLSSSAAMGLTGLPEDIPSTPSTPPTLPAPTDPGPNPTPGCQVTGVTADPSTINIIGNNPTKVHKDVTFTVQTNGACGAVTLMLNGAPLPGNVLPGGTPLDEGDHSIVVLVNGISVASFTVKAN